jgi:hypothetical protein
VKKLFQQRDMVPPSSILILGTIKKWRWKSFLNGDAEVSQSEENQMDPILDFVIKGWCLYGFDLQTHKYPWWKLTIEFTIEWECDMKQSSIDFISHVGDWKGWKQTQIRFITQSSRNI